jgi:predicted nucleic acid-binding protein
LAARRGRINREQRDKILEDLAGLNIVTDADTQTFAWTATLRLAERYRLTLYDACYLELAQRLQLPLATLDQDLRRAAGALGLELLGA